MNNETYKSKKSRKPLSVKAIVLLVVLIMLFTGAITGTLSFLATGTSSIANEFYPGEVTCAVSDTGVVSNTGTVSAYLRAAVVVNWVDASGNVYGKPPAATVNAGTGWFKADSDGYYYYTSPVAAGSAASAITASTLDEAPSAEYSLQVLILAEAIQADGTDSNGDHPVEIAWKVTINETTKAISKN